MSTHRPTGESGAAACRGIALLLVLALAAPACSGGASTPRITPDTTGSQTTAPAPTTEPPPEPAAELEGWPGTEPARRLATALRRVLVGQTGCQSDSDLADLESRAAAAPPEIRELLRAAAEDLRTMAGACNADADAWRSALDDALDDLQEVAEVLGGPPSPAGLAPADPAASAGRAVGVLDGLHNLLYGGGRIPAPAYWTSALHAGRHLDLLAGDEEGGFEVVAVGSSLIVNGFIPDLFADVDGRRAFNAGLPALTAEQLAVWLDDAARLADPDVVVYGVSHRDVRALDEIEGACTSSTEDWDFAAGLRRDAFDPVDVMAQVGWDELLRARPGGPVVRQDYRNRFDDTGGRTGWPTSSDAQMEGSIADLEAEGPYAECPGRYDALGAAVAAAASGGVQVVVVLMPVSDTHAALVEGGRARVDGVNRLIEAAAVEAGAAAVFDMSDLVPDALFRDLAHVDEEGAGIVTSEIARRLEALGI